jgi:predicted PurR-regulated permease PerM
MASAQDKEDARVFRRRTLVIAGVLLGVAAVVWTVFRLKTLLFMIFVAVAVAIAFEPPVHFLEKRGWKRGTATGVVLLAALVVIAGFTWALAPLFVAQINEVISAIPQVVESLIGFLDGRFGIDLSEVDPEQIGSDLGGYLQSAFGTIAGGLLSIGASLVGFLVFVTTVGLFAFYMIAELPQLQRTVLSFMPEPQQHRALYIWDVAVEKMGGYVYSRLLLAVLAAMVSTAALGFLGVPFSLSLGIWVGFLSQFIPVVGTYLAAILPVLVALTFNDTTTAIWVAVIFIAYQQVENYIFAPWVTRHTMEIHPAVSVGAIIAGASLLGGVGVILALPVTGIVQAILSESRRPHDVVLDDPESAPSYDHTNDDPGQG